MMDTLKLRQKLLDLAIRGKLVPQDPNDEPASVLLERIHAEKVAMVERGELKPRDIKGDTVIFIGSDGLPYEKGRGESSTSVPIERALLNLPSGWSWARLRTIASVEAGKTPSKDAFVDDGIPYFKMYNLRNQRIDFDFQPQYIKPEVHFGQLAKSRIRPGDLIMNIVGPPLGKLAIAPETFPEANTNQAAVVIRSYAGLVPIIWLFYYLSEMSEIDSVSTRGSAGQVNISVNQSRDMIIPIPPLAEQRRIVEALDKYLALVDEIEQAQADLDALFAQLKSKVLDLAIRGELTAQDPDDEPASVLLERIHAEKVAMVKRGELKPKDIKGDTVIFTGSDGLRYEKPANGSCEARCIEDEIPFAIPNTWAWARLGSVSNYGSASSVSVEDISDDGWILDLEDIEKDTGRVLQKIKKSERPSSSVKRPFWRGQLLYSKLRPYLNKVLIADEDGYCTSEILPIELYGSIDPKYVRRFLMSDHFLAYADICVYGCKMPRLGTGDGQRALIPIPPLAEQSRITRLEESLIDILTN